MMNAVEIVVNYLSSTLFAITILSTGKARFSKKKEFLVAALIAVVYGSVVTSFNYVQVFEGMIGVAIYFFLYLLGTLVAVKTPFWKRLLAAAYWEITLILSSTVAISVVKVLFGSDYEEIITTRYDGRFLVLFLSLLTKVVLSFILCILNRRQLAHLQMYDGITITGCFVVFFLLGACFVVAGLGTFRLNIIAITAVLMLLLFLGGIACLLRISSLQNRNHRQEVLIELINGQKLESSEIEEMNHKLHVLQHDLRKHMRIVEGLVESGNNELARQYLQELCEESQEMTGYCEYTGNSLVDTVLCKVSNDMRGHGIKFQIVCSLKDFRPSAKDISILLANILDNALEAARQCESGEVKLNLGMKNEYIHIRCQNTVKQQVLNTNPNLQTTKEDTEHHGWGIKSIRSIAAKYSGLVKFEEHDNFFVADVVLNNMKEKNTKTGISA